MKPEFQKTKETTAESAILETLNISDFLNVISAISQLGYSTPNRKGNFNITQSKRSVSRIGEPE